MKKFNQNKHQFGFTLVELIMVIIILGIIAAISAVYIQKPVQGYVSSVKRAQLTDAADVTLRRITRDIRLALPNSIRVNSSGGKNYIEFVMTKSGGQYRDSFDGSTSGNFLSFTDSTVKTFDMVGVVGNVGIGDYIAIYNLGEGYDPADVYSQKNMALVSGVAGRQITMTNNVFAVQSPPMPSPSNRFQVIDGNVKAVTYECSDLPSRGNLMRYQNYGFNASQVSGVPTGSTQSILIQSIAGCHVTYTPAIFGNTALLYIELNLESDNEQVSLFHEIHVDNTP